MAMTKTHFIGISNVLKAQKPCPSNFGDDHEYRFAYVEWRKVVEGLCDYFKEQNAQFDRDRFVKACGGF